MNRTLSAIVGFVLLCACVAHAAEIVIKPGDNAQDKINGYRSGDTIRFDGSRLVSTVYNVPNNGTVTIESTPGTTVQAQHHSFVLFMRGAKGVTIRNMDFAGGGVYMEKCSWMNVTGNKFHDIRNNSGNAVHAVWHIDLLDSQVVGNRFYNMIGPGVDTGIFGYGPKRCKFNLNRFYNVHEGIHNFYYDRIDSRGDNEVMGNEFVGTERHDIEQQYCANGLKTQYNHISGRQPDKNGMGNSNATGGVPGASSTSGQNSSWNVEVGYNVFDFRGVKETDFSQNAGVEAMRSIDVHHNWFVGNNSGRMQGILHSQNTAGWTSRFNQFQNISHWYSGGSGSPVIPPIVAKDAEGKSSDKAFTGEPPTYDQLIAMMNGAPAPTPPPVPPVNAPTLATKAYRTKVHVTHTPGATLEKRAGQGGFRPVTLNAEGYDTNFDFDPNANEVESKWRFYYRATLNGVSSTEVEAQIGINPDPAPMPVPPPQQPIGTWLKGDPWDVFAIPDGATLKLTATTRPTKATVSQ